MATVATSGEAPRREVSLERIFSRGFGTIRANPVATLGIAFLCGALPSVLINLAVRSVQTASVMARIGFSGMIALSLLSLVIGIVLNAITQGALVRATVAHSRGRESSFGESITAGLVVIIPLIAASILNAIAVGVGFVLLIVPGIMLYCRWAVIAPIVVEERTGPIAAFGRSAALTDGARWKVLGLTALVVVGAWIVQGALAGALIATLGFRSLGTAPGNFGASLGYLVVTVLVATLVSCVWSVLVSALYVELRDWKDGPPVETLAEVFR